MTIDNQGRISEIRTNGSAVLQQDDPNCMPVITIWNDPPVTCDACEAEVDAHYELYELPFFADIFVCASCLNSCGGILSEQAELGHKAMKLKEVKR